MTVKKCVVIHNGSHTTVAGFSNMELPAAIISTSYVQKGAERVFGTFAMLDECEKQEPCEVYTIIDKNGLPYNWDALEAQWRYLYQHELQVDPQDLPLVISVPATHAELDPQVVESYFELAFHKLRVPALQIVVEPLAVALAMGKSTALVVDVGARGTTVTPIVDGTVVRSGVMKSRFGGDFLDYQVAQLLEEPLGSSSREAWYNSATWIREFKSTMLQVCDKSLVELERYHRDQLQLQQQQQQQLGAAYHNYMANPLTQKRNFLHRARKQTVTLELRDCYRACEPLFQPALASSDYAGRDGLGELLARAVKKAGASVSAQGTPGGGLGASLVYHQHAHAQQPLQQPDQQASSAATATTEQVYAQLLTNVVLTGATSLVGGFEQRVVSELSVRFPQNKLATYANQIHLDRAVQGWIAMGAMAALPGWELGRWYSPRDAPAPAPTPGTRG